MEHGPYWNPGIETMPWNEVREMQGKRLREHLLSLQDRSPFYAAKFADAGFDPAGVESIDDLARAPFTEKTELRESQEQAPPLGAHAGVPLSEVIRIHSSSGTTGRPSYVGITRRDRDIWTETVSRVYYCEGLRATDVFIHGFGLGFFVGGLPLKDAVENIGATFVPIGTGASERLLTSARDLDATVLTCTPSYAKYLAEYCWEQMGMDPRDLGLRRVLLGAEPGGAVPGVRKVIADAYGAHVTEGLGNADVLPVYSATCDELDGNHFLAPDTIAFEVVDPETGEPFGWEDGVEGELVTTHLQRDCVPLVRFRTRDRVVCRTSPCPCGRTGPRLTCIGRTDDMLIVAGVNVWPSAVSDVVASFQPRTTGNVQILLTEPGPRVDPPLRVQVEHAPDEADVDGLRRAVAERLRDRLIVRVDVDLVPPGTLPRFEMKAQLIRKLYAEPAAS